MESKKHLKSFNGTKIKTVEIGECYIIPPVKIENTNFEQLANKPNDNVFLVKDKKGVVTNKIIIDKDIAKKFTIKYLLKWALSMLNK